MSGQLHEQVALSPPEKYPGTHWGAGCVGPSDGLEVLKKMGPQNWSGGFGEKWASLLVWRFWRRMGPQSWSGGFGEKFCILTGTQILKGAATSSVTTQSSRWGNILVRRRIMRMNWHAEVPLHSFLTLDTGPPLVNFTTRSLYLQKSPVTTELAAESDPRPMCWSAAANRSQTTRPSSRLPSHFADSASNYHNITATFDAARHQTSYWDCVPYSYN